MQFLILMMSIAYVQTWERNAKFANKMSPFMSWVWIQSGILDLLSGGPYTQD